MTRVVWFNYWPSQILMPLLHSSGLQITQTVPVNLLALLSKKHTGSISNGFFASAYVTPLTTFGHISLLLQDAFALQPEQTFTDLKETHDNDSTPLLSFLISIFLLLFVYASCTFITMPFLAVKIWPRNKFS